MVRLRGSLALYDGYIAFQSSRVWCYEMPDEKMGDNLQLARRTAVSSKSGTGLKRSFDEIERIRQQSRDPRVSGLKT
jgi:hypothetical protein